MKFKEIQAKTMLVKSNIPDADYVINPYTGCIFGCLYCYASFMSRFVGESVDNWGKFLYVKANAVEALERQLARWPDRQRKSSVLISSVTDPYQGAEAKYKLTRGILQTFAKEKYPGQISILTKSHLVLRDKDILKKLKKADVGMTVTTTDDKISRFLEVRAPPASKRIAALKELHEEGIDTYAFVGPLFPHFKYQPELLDNLFGELADAEVDSVYVEHLNLKPHIKGRLMKLIKDEPEEVKTLYKEAGRPSHVKELDRIVMKLIKKHKLKLRFGQTIKHDKSWKLELRKK